MPTAIRATVASNRTALVAASIIEFILFFSSALKAVSRVPYKLLINTVIALIRTRSVGKALDLMNIETINITTSHTSPIVSLTLNALPTKLAILDGAFPPSCNSHKSNPRLKTIEQKVANTKELVY